MFQVRVKTPADEVFSLDVTPSTTVEELKRLVIEKTLKVGEDAATRTVKLIASGKLLNPNHAKIVSFGVIEGSFIHAMLSKVSIASLSDSSTRDIEAGPSAPLVLRGIDRLRIQYGFAADEVAALRRGFSDSLARYAADHPRREGEDADDYQYRMEDEWMLLQDEDFEYAVNPNRSIRLGTDHESVVGTLKEVMYGFALGFILGIFMLVGIWNTEISYYQKMGILIGVFTNLLMSSSFSSAPK